MAQYAIMRFAKQKGGFGALEAHHERTKAKYVSNPDIKIERSRYNFHIVKPEKSYRQESDSRIAEAGCKTRKDSVRFVDTLITASPEFFKGKKREGISAYFGTAVEFLSKKIGKDNIITAVVHLDEKTPHMHLCFTPITDDGRLSAKDIIGNRTQLTKWQDEFFNHMVRKYPDLERGKSASRTGRRHIPTRLFKQAVSLSKQATHITAILDGIKPLNAGKKRDEILALLNKFFPKMEAFETQLKKYGRELNLLTKENISLKKRVNNAEKSSIPKQLEDAKLRVEYDALQTFVDKLPEDIKREARAQAEKLRDYQR